MPAAEPDHGASAPAVSRFLFDEKQHADKHVPLGDLIWLDRERCIQCARCIRFQEDIAGEPVLAFYQRGRATDIVTYSEPGFDSIFSRQHHRHLPGRRAHHGGLPLRRPPLGNESTPPRSVRSARSAATSPSTPAAKPGQAANMVIKRAMPRQNEQVNEIWMCDKGRFAGYHFGESSERLNQPLIKGSAAELDAAEKLVAEKLKAAGPDSVVLAGGRLSNEDLFNLKQLADGLGGKALLHTPIGGGEFTAAYGLTAGSNFGDLGKGSTILVVASDIHDEAPVWYLRIKAGCPARSDSCCG